MDELAELQDATAALLKKAKESTVADLASAVEKATEVVRLKTDLDQSAFAARKLALEEAQLQHAVDDEHKHEKSNRAKDFFSLLTPLISVLVVVATLIFQVHEFEQSETDKVDATEDAQWQDAVKTILQASNVPRGVVALHPFFKSPRYGDLAREETVTLLASTDDQRLFVSLFGAAFVPVGWNNVNRVIQLDRALAARWAPLLAKQYSKGSTLSPQEHTSDAYLQYAIDQITAEVGNLLEGPRQNGIAPDLSATQFERGDWKGANLSGASITSMWLSYTDLQGADLDNIKQYDGAYFEATKWWKAKSMSAGLIVFLKTNDPCNPGHFYGPTLEAANCEEYAPDVLLLEHQAALERPRSR